MSPLVSARTLATEIASTAPPVLLDVRWSLTAPDGRPDYLSAHLPGAVYVSLEDDLSAHGEPHEGRHPLPTTDSLQASARAWGLRQDDTVVVYDAGASLAAARAWWLLTDAGLDVRVLDGGLTAWARAGLPTESGPITPAPGDVVLSTGHLRRIDIDDAAAHPRTGILLDARAPERYRGHVEPIDPKAGHIPGALSAFTADNLHPDGTFLTPTSLAARFDALGATADADIAVYCGSGVTAAHQILALASAGRPAALYPGSWSQWSHTPGRPVATGTNPEGA